MLYNDLVENCHSIFAQNASSGFYRQHLSLYTVVLKKRVTLFVTMTTAFLDFLTLFTNGNRNEYEMNSLQ